ncbi:peptidase, M50 family [Megasphaera vaginalis (ex Srinivasan et al. 2021)]|uniref:Peptidase, M50 family n=2 Tax=Megasphaera TaxID=906 RepID=U7UQM4_9FIRM|nr:site-2 protease family protein [uncultured Megasphaera sp.]ERT61727.1 peptidase, M50 family [Megasphaera vaginalis (ex Srinivasan et al. 2021)]
MFGFDFASIIAGIPGLLMAMVFHEFAHAFVADRMGDPTPRMTGRLTLNPVVHIDPIGLIMLFVARFGWAKPVMINPNHFKNWRKGEVCVSLAGPAANLLLAFLAMFVKVCLFKTGLLFSHGLNLVLDLIVLYNVNFAIFNLIPIPPLDGSRLLTVLLPSRWSYRLAALERYSFLILIVFVMTPVFSYILIPLQRLVLGVFGIFFSLFL